MTLEVAYTTQLLACSEEVGRGEAEGEGRGREGRREEGRREKGWEREHSGVCKYLLVELFAKLPCKCIYIVSVKTQT